MEPPPPEAVVFIDDDDEDLLLEDEWQTDAVSTAADALAKHAGQIQLQLRLCFALALMLPVLTVLIVVAWRRYGDAIYKPATSATAALPPGRGKKER